MILGVGSSLVTVIPEASYNLPERLSVFLKVEERHLLDPIFGHKMEMATVTFMTSCSPWNRKIAAV